MLGAKHGDLMAKPKTPSPARSKAREESPDPGHRLRFRARLPSTRESINNAVKRVMKMAAEMGCRKSDMADIEIALREALANAVFHGNQGDPEKKVLLRCYLSPAKGILLAIRDEGKGFDPGDIPDPRETERLYLHHGRGIFLMRNLMDRVEHRRGGREVVLYKEGCPSPRKRPAKATRPSAAGRRKV